MSARTATAALRTLAVLLVVEVCIPYLQVAVVGREYLPRTILATIVGGAILAALYHHVSRGSSTARTLLTALSGLGVLFVGVALFLEIRSPALAVISGLGVFVRVAVIVLVNTNPIKALSPEPILPQSRPVSTTHQHDWRPHALLDGWIQCAECKGMHIEPGTIALINKKP